MKPRWTIVAAPPVALGGMHEGTRWLWCRTDRNGRCTLVGCVCHHSWTKRVRAFEVTP